VALVKKTGSNSSPVEESKPSASASREAEAQRRRARTMAKQQQAAERIAAATAQLSSGITEASSASEELRRAAELIASGAEESASASQESLEAFKLVTQAINRQLDNANLGQTKSEIVQHLVVKTADDIARLINNVGVAAVRQAASVQQVGELEKQAANIGDIVKAVVRIADQTNLLALNAAIEAARAGKHGKGFAVVADEVRTLAETSEKSAKQIQDLVGQIQVEVKGIAEGINQSANNITVEVEKGKAIGQMLEQIRSDVSDVVKGIQEIVVGAQQSNDAANQALRGAEEIAASAEQQSAAAEETAKTVNEQTQALNESEKAAQDLSDIADDLKNSTNVAKSSEDVASSAEELSSAVQELNRAAAQIMTAIDQIRRGAQTAAAATEESAAAVSQIKRGLDVSLDRSKTGAEKIANVSSLLSRNKQAVEQLIAGIAGSVTSTQASIRQVKDLEQVSRRIDKIVEAITTVSIQTNMLAVNGSIEAARAGEFGKGFVVVSTDIRNLARDSAENADRIKDLVKGVQDQIAFVSNDLDELIKSAVAETDQAKTCSENLIAIEADIFDIQQGTEEILGAASEIAAAIAQAQKGIEQISAASQESERAATEAAGAARQQAQGAEELAAAIEEIASLADELQSL
jgi:methyl-accepting chemotaxis protein